MRTKAHYGTASGACALLLLSSNLAPATVACSSVLMFAQAPNWETRVSVLSRRGGLHTLAGALTIGLCLTLTTWSMLELFKHAVTTTGWTGTIIKNTVYWSAVFGGGATIGTTVHVISDTVTVGDSKPGARVLWPLSARRFTLRLVNQRRPTHQTLVARTGLCLAVLVFLYRIGVRPQYLS